MLAVAAILGELFLTALGGILIISDPLQPADAVAVLSGAKDLGRMQEAVRLYQDKYAGLFILTETGESLENYDSSVSFYYKLQALDMGIPNGAILITDEQASSTEEEARAIRDLLERSGLKSCIVVTDPFHTFRTRIIFREVFADSDIHISVRPVRGHWYRSSTWWMSAEGRQATFLEYTKLLGHLLGLRPTWE
ncbi:MAG: YdcF family protein [Chloroflexi bacterium]|nr:YdcF family protein [Chloroflexota bacterium]